MLFGEVFAIIADMTLAVAKSKFRLLAPIVPSVLVAAHIYFFAGFSVGIVQSQSASLLPDLIAKNFRYTRLDDQMFFIIQFDFGNVGQAKVEGLIKVKTTNLTTGRVLRETTYSGFSPEGWSSEIILSKIGDEIVLGKNNIEVSIDPDNTINEADEVDNVKQWEFNSDISASDIPSILSVGGGSNFFKVGEKGTLGVDAQSSKTPLSYSVDWGDGTFENYSQSPNFTRVFCKAGVYKVTFSAIAPGGLSSSRTMQLTIGPSEAQLVTSIDRALISRLKGMILLQVQSYGEAWYLDPLSKQRYYLANGWAAYEALRKFGLGISNADLNKIPPASPSTQADMPVTYYDQALVSRLLGRILLQTESRGEAWYLNPRDSKRYYLANGEAAYQIMRSLSLGVTTSNLHKIPVGELEKNACES